MLRVPRIHVQPSYLHGNPRLADILLWEFFAFSYCTVLKYPIHTASKTALQADTLRKSVLVRTQLRRTMPLSIQQKRFFSLQSIAHPITNKGHGNRPVLDSRCCAHCNALMVLRYASAASPWGIQTIIHDQNNHLLSDKKLLNKENPQHQKSYFTRGDFFQSTS